MRVALYTQDQSLAEVFMEELIMFGVWLSSFQNYDEFEAKVEAKRFHCLVLDIDNRQIDWLFFLHNLKGNKDKAGTYIVLLTSFNNHDYLEPFLSEGINAIFDKKLPVAHYLNQIRGIFNILDGELSYEDKRRYVRIQPPQNETIPVFLEISSGSGSVKAKLRDLSVIAAAIIVEKKESIDLIQEGQELESIQLMLNKKTYFTKAKVIKKAMDPNGSRHILILSFCDPSPVFKKGIVHYIYEKMQEDVKEAPIT